MKALLTTVIAIAAFSISAAAQTPVIKDLRTIVADATNSFASLRGEMTEENKEKGATFYKSKLEAAGAEAFMVKMEATGKVVYAIRYNMKDIQTMMLPLISKIVEQYVQELNDMVKTGNYTGRDYTDANGMSVTEINDKAGHHILDYSSNADEQSIYVFSWTKS